MATVAILDVDGTLVDTNYQHALAWYRAFRQHEVPVPIWRVHRHIGMGGDQLVSSLAGEQVEREQGEDIRTAEAALYMEMIHEVQAMPGARELVRSLETDGWRVVLASSAKPREIDHYLALLGVDDLITGSTSAADVQSTKPAPDLIETAMDKAGDRDAVMVGDSTWDCEAARRAQIPSVAVLTGGFCESELREAGAAAVFESLQELCTHLADTPLARSGQAPQS